MELIQEQFKLKIEQVFSLVLNSSWITRTLSVGGITSLSTFTTTKVIHPYPSQYTVRLYAMSLVVLNSVVRMSHPE